MMKKDNPSEISEKSYCPHSNLPIRTKPEWKNVVLDEAYRASFIIIGEKILLIIPEGNPTLLGVTRLNEKRKKVLEEETMLKKGFVEIRDYAKIEGRPGREARLALTNFLLEEDRLGRMLGFWVFNAPPVIRWMFNVGRKIHPGTKPVSVVSDYQTAMNHALSVLKKNEIERNPSKSTKRNIQSSRFVSGMFSVEFRLIESDLIYTISRGVLHESQVDPFFRFYREFLSGTGIMELGYYYRIGNWEDLIKSSYNARKTYLEYLRKLQEEIPCRLGVLFGLNPLMVSIYLLSRSRIPFSVLKAKNYNEAISMIQLDKEKQTSKVNASEEILPGKNDPDEMERFNMEILELLGTINWEKKGFSVDDIPESHPFKSVFNAIHLLKMDVDDILRERDQAFQEVRKSEEKYRTILNSIEEGYYEIDREGNITFHNRAFAKMLSWPDTRIHQVNIREILEPSCARQAFRVLEKIGASNTYGTGLIWKMVGYSGDEIDVELSAASIKNADGVLEGFRGLVRDISEQGRMEEITQAKLLAESANEAKSEFLAKMSHEIRTPLNAVIGLTDLMKETRLSEKQEDYLDKIRSSAKSLLEIVNDILDYSKIEAGKMNLGTKDFCIRDMMDNLRDMFLHYAKKKNLRISFEVDQEIPEVLKGDPLRLKQVMVNLIGNALKFTEKGKVEVFVELVAFKKEKVELQFSVRDTGIGIPKNRLKELFTPFTQVDESSTRKFSGTGLGLAICKNIVEMMGSKIHVESDVNSGSVFSFSLELFNEPETETYLLNNGERLNDIWILVVESDSKLKNRLVNILHSYRIRVISVSSEEEAIQILKQNEQNFDIVISGWSIPGINGIGLTKRIRMETKKKDIPVILVTKYRRSDDISQAVAAGVKAYLVAPVAPSILHLHIMEALGKTSPERKRTVSDDSQTFTSGEGHGAKVLIVDDQPINLQITSELLQKAGYETETVESGRQALGLINRKKFDAVLMDIQMPEMDGHETTRNIRKKLNSLIPIIAMTAYADTGDRETCLKSGMNDYIPKPVEKERLFSVLRKWIGQTGTENTQGAGGETLQEKPGITSLSVPGIDIRLGLKRTCGDMELLKNVIIEFRDRYRDFPGKVEKAFMEKDLNRLGKLCHTIKGIAGNISATDLFESALALEKAIKHGTGDDVSKCVSHFSSVMRALIHSLDHLNTGKQYGNRERKVENASIDTVIQSLSGLIDENDIKTESYLLSCIPILENAGFKTEAGNLLEQLNVFDFKSARKTLSTILSSVRRGPVL